MTENPLVKSNEKPVELKVTIEKTFEELEERTAPKLVANHNETLVVDLED
jgi:hypothetical protein